jgi:hypothetical protein
MLMLIAAPVVLLVVAVGLTAMGLRGRVIDDHPLCRRCRFDLVGLWTPAKCPECGASLAAPNSIRTGHRRRRWLPLSIGGVLLVLLTGSAVTIGVASSRGYNFNTAMPDWMLELKGRSSDSSKANSALLELARRLNAREMDAEQAQRLVEEGLENQANVAAPWLPGWGDIIEAAHANGLVTQDQWKRYGRHAFPVATIVWAHETYVIGADVRPVRLGSSLAVFEGQFDITDLSAADKSEIRRGGGTTSARIISSGNARVLMQQLLFDFPPGGRIQVHAK